MNPNFPENNKPIILYRNPLSGHCHRVELLMAFMSVPYTTIDLDMANGAHKSPDYLKINPFGQVPVINDNGVFLPDSNAILVYLAKKYGEGTATEWLPEEPETAAEVQRWLSIAAGEIAAGPGAARLVNVFGASLDHDLAKSKAEKLFDTMEPLLAARNFLAGNTITIADVSGYSYIAHAPEGGVSLAPYPHIRAWIARIEAMPNFIGMKKSPLPKAA